MFNNLRNRFTLIFVSLTIIPLIFVSSINSVRTYNREVEVSLEAQRLLNGHFGRAIEDTFTARIDEIVLLDQVYGLALADLSEQRDLVGNLLVERSAYSEISILNPDGQERIRVSRLGAITDNDLRDRSTDPLYTDIVASGEIRLSEVFTDETSGEPSVTIGVPVYDLRTGEISSLIFADFRFRLIWDIVAQLQDEVVDGDLEVFLVDETGAVIAHANPTIVLRGTRYDVPAEDGEANDLNGKEAFVTSEVLPIQNQNYTIVGSETTSTALEPAINAVTNSIIIVGLTLLTTILVVTIVIRQIIRPIERLSKSAQAIRDGDFSIRSSIKRNDEIGILARSFDDMASRLQDLINNLEFRIGERTRDLKIASDVAREITSVLDLNTLLPNVAEQTRAGFDLYHMSVFLYDADTQVLSLVAGTREAGAKMLAEGKSFHIDDQGIVPLVARQQKFELVNDVSISQAHVQNPYLPETQAELVLPMIVNNKLIGVLDLQAKQKDRFSQDDIQVLNTLAEQVAIAVQNAQLYKAVEKAFQEADKANSIKSQFLASVSHELRTPLNAILNFTKFVLSHKMGEINERQSQALTNVVQSADHLLGLINDVLDISKIESGSLKLFVQPDISVEQELRAVHEITTSLLNGKPVEVTVKIDDELPKITGDRQRIRQIILNLVSNACKFTHNGQITLAAFKQNSDIVIEVGDTGPGIAEHEQEAIFEVFTQSESGLRSGQGTGLGLPISKRLTEAHGGNLWLESAPGKGSRFFVSLPINSLLEPTLP